LTRLLALFFRKICGFKPLSAEDIFAEFAKRGSITPGSKTPINFTNFAPVSSEVVRPASNLLTGPVRSQMIAGEGKPEEDQTSLQMKV